MNVHPTYAWHCDPHPTPMFPFRVWFVVEETQNSMNCVFLLPLLYEAVYFKDVNKMKSSLIIYKHFLFHFSCYFVSSEGPFGDIMYSLVGDQSKYFSIDADTGVITVLNSTYLDRERQPEISFSVMATDKAPVTTRRSTVVPVRKLNHFIRTAPFIVLETPQSVFGDIANKLFSLLCHTWPPRNRIRGRTVRTRTNIYDVRTLIIHINT